MVVALLLFFDKRTNGPTKQITEPLCRSLKLAVEALPRAVAAGKRSSRQSMHETHIIDYNYAFDR